ncbi:uncharacterized protein [Drosophila suzukii]|uniref:Uncharacterized protein n=1 Tax=Drosophila suzukii TaxID=28584 RepID=A0AB40ACZ6_DROSZ
MRFLFCLCLLAICAYALPLDGTVGSIFSILWPHKYPPGFTPVMMGLDTVYALTPCTRERTPTTFYFDSNDECSKKCSGHCAVCNATCIFGNRCVCGTATYCVYDPNTTNIKPGALIPRTCQPIENFIDRN